MFVRSLREKVFDKIAGVDILPEIDAALTCPIAKKVATMMATSHEYKKPNIDGALAMVKNYDWQETTAKVKNLQGLDKPVNQEKVLKIAEGIRGKKAAPLIVVNSIHGIRPQSQGKKILLDGHHRLAALEHNEVDETPVYLGTFTGEAQLPKDELRKSAWLRTRTLEKLSAAIK